MKPQKSSDKKPAKSQSARIACSTPAAEKDAVAREARKHAILTKRVKLFRATQELERIRSEMLVELYELADEYNDLCRVFTAP